MGRTKAVKLPEWLYQQLKQKAEIEGRTLSEVIESLLKQVPPDLFTPQPPPEEPEHRCLFCERPVEAGRRICNDCFYDPNIIRPQRFGAFYYHYAMKVAPKEGLLTTFDGFIVWLTKKRAKQLYGVTEKEWKVWKEWVKWRKAFREGKTNKDDLDWRQWCLWAMKEGFVGYETDQPVEWLLFYGVGKEMPKEQGTTELPSEEETEEDEIAIP